MHISSVQCETANQVFWKAVSEQDLLSDLTVFKISLPEFGGHVQHMIKILTADETERAAKYHFEKDRNRFIIVRGVLRIILSKITGINPADINFKLSPNKKPYLPELEHIHFNVSHSGNYALVAVANADVGVDVEHIDSTFHFNDLLENNFSEPERIHIRNSPDQVTEFYKLWTRKESFGKATSLGLSVSLNRLPAMDGLNNVAGEIAAFKNWRTVSFMIDTQAAGSVSHQALSAYQMIQFMQITKDFVLNVF